MKRVMSAVKKIDPCLPERLGGVLLPYCPMAKEGLLRGPEEETVSIGQICHMGLPGRERRGSMRVPR